MKPLTFVVLAGLGVAGYLAWRSIRRTQTTPVRAIPATPPGTGPMVRVMPDGSISMDHRIFKPGSIIPNILPPKISAPGISFSADAQGRKICPAGYRPTDNCSRPDKWEKINGVWTATGQKVAVCAMLAMEPYHCVKG